MKTWARNQDLCESFQDGFLVGFEEVTSMKFKDKLKSTIIYSRPIDKDDLQAAYEDGFEKAKELAINIAESNHDSSIISHKISNIYPKEFEYAVEEEA